jgi:hypothetical protein
MNFNEVKLKVAALNADPALKAILEKHGFFLHEGRAVGCSFHNESRVRLQLGTSTVAPADLNLQHRNQWLSQCETVGLKKHWLDKVVDYAGKFYRINGLDFSNSRGYYVKATRVKDGKTFFLEHRAVARAMGDA